MTSQALLLSRGKFQAQPQLIKAVPRYNAANESRIPHTWWVLDRAGITSNLKDISECIGSTVKDRNGLDAELKHISMTASKLDQVEHETPVKVALIGAQGAGKSLMINALFDCPGLSLTGAKGFACTSAIIKYAFGPGDKFTAEVKFLNAKKREEMVDEHIRSYVTYHNDLEDSDDEGNPRTRSSSEDEIERKRKKTAEDFFDTMFGSREEFLSAWSSSPVNTGEFKSLCQLKCKETMDEFDKDSKDTVLFSKATAKELLEDIKPFITNVKDKVCLWPIVDCVTIRFNHELLKLGLELIDLPGSGDINMLRARHADEVKDGVDVEIILAPSDRIGTNDTLISSTRAGVLNHGPANVKVIATKTDVLSDDEVSNCVGGIYDEIDQLLQEVDDAENAAIESGDETNLLTLQRYTQYLFRHKRVCMIKDRAKDIDKGLGETFSEFCHDGKVQIIHTSTADYMNWIKSENIHFDRQPALSPEETGVPVIRRFLYDLPANNNLRDYTYHIKTVVPGFVEKLKRIITQADRNIGFVTIADNFDHLRDRFMRDLVTQIKWHYLEYLKLSISKVRKDAKLYREGVNRKIHERWLLFKCASLNRILKGRGTVPKGVSKAQGLQAGVNWNQDLANIMRPGFQRWFAIHDEHLKLLKDALPPTMDWLFRLVAIAMSNSAADMFTVERAKMKWKPMRTRMQSKLLAMIDEMISEESRALNRATMKDERENNVIADMTDKIYTGILKSTPKMKPTPEGKPIRYVSSVYVHRKEKLQDEFISHPEGHFVDRLIAAFQHQLQEKMYGIVDKHFTKLNAMLDEFSRTIRDQGPITVDVNPLGVRLREELEAKLPYIDAKVEALRALLPANIKGEDEADADIDDNVEDFGGSVKKDLSYFIDIADKKKKKRISDDYGPTQMKRIKQEPT